MCVVCDVLCRVASVSLIVCVFVCLFKNESVVCLLCIVRCCMVVCVFVVLCLCAACLNVVACARSWFIVWRCSVCCLCCFGCALFMWLCGLSYGLFSRCVLVVV